MGNLVVKDTCLIYPEQRPNFDLKDLAIPGDKSISHRSALIAAMASNQSRIKGYLNSEDCLNTLKVLRQLGVSIIQDNDTVIIQGLDEFLPSKDALDVGNSGTLIRLLMGVLASQSQELILTGDHSIQSRPMQRVLDPLKQMGVSYKCLGTKAGTPPIQFKGKTTLKSITYHMHIASAQVKSAIMLAALKAHGETRIVEPIPTRDHTERMLLYFGASVHKKNQVWSIPGNQVLHNPSPQEAIIVPADISSASFFIVLALLKSNKKVCLTNIGLNPTRIGVLKVFEKMGCKLQVESASHPFEQVGHITCETSPIQNIKIPVEWVPNIIDEIPILSVLASKGAGPFEIRGAKELRVKESDRLAGIQRLYQAAEMEIDVFEDGFITRGPQQANTFIFDAMHDHRLAMSAIILALVHNVSARITGCASIATSFPNFFDLLKQANVQFELE